MPRVLSKISVKYAKLLSEKIRQISVKISYLIRMDQIDSQREEVRIRLRIEEPELHLQSRQPEQGLVQVGLGDLPRLDRRRQLRQV